MAFSLPCTLGNILGSGCSFGRHFLANSAETILEQMLKTARNLEIMCSKNSCETGTKKGMFMNKSKMALKIKSQFFLPMSWIFRAEFSFTEYTDIDFVYCSI